MKIPERQCLACRAKKKKPDLLRVVKSPSGEVSPDPSGKKPGRGAYLCQNRACLARARKARGLERAFKMQVPAELYDALDALIEA